MGGGGGETARKTRRVEEKGTKGIGGRENDGGQGRTGSGGASVEDGVHGWGELGKRPHVREATWKAMAIRCLAVRSRAD